MTFNKYICLKVKVLVAQSCPTLYNLMDCSLPASSVHGILQTRLLERVAIPFSRESSCLRGWTQISFIAGGFFTIWANKLGLSFLLLEFKHIFKKEKKSALCLFFCKERLKTNQPDMVLI